MPSRQAPAVGLGAALRERDFRIAGSAGTLAPDLRVVRVGTAARAAGSRSRIGAVAKTLAAVVLLAIGARAEAAEAPPAMIVPGQFNVGPTGAATYTIPIAVPPGTAGMVPALSLDYSSQGGDGIVGFGWTLSGLSSIGRCARTLAQDGVHGGVNYDANDRFCMEGQRLVAVGTSSYCTGGEEYRTEIEGFSRIVSCGTAGNGPAYFMVWTKAGQRMEFGNTASSQILAVGTSTVRSWAVDKISDTKGNYLTVTYVNDTTNGQAYPTEVDYTGNASAGTTPYNSVRFTYNTARPDVTPAYQAGSLQQTTVLLTHVQTYQGANLVYDYQLGYRLGSSTMHSRLTSVTLCDGGTTRAAWRRRRSAGRAARARSVSRRRPMDWPRAPAIRCGRPCREETSTAMA